MKSISDNLLILALALVLGISPFQTISASISGCLDMEQNMSTHHQEASVNMSHGGMSHQGNQHDCCEQNTCDMSGCAASVAVMVEAVSQNDMTCIVSNIYLQPNTTLLQYYPSSLYRPPRV
ncbi:MAG: hypothetical protein OEY78_01425 [Gammaproteobacteria bacterium]|nr:hypothetical protein [Gammaproteobacteria bacterium]